VVQRGKIEFQQDLMFLIQGGERINRFPAGLNVPHTGRKESSSRAYSSWYGGRIEFQEDSQFLIRGRE
jgi:hypothetical protein